MLQFTHTTHPQRVIFAIGARRRLGAELERLGIGHVLLLSTPDMAGMAADILAADTLAEAGPIRVTPFAGAVMHTPVSVTETAMTLLRESGAGAIVSVGGGSTIGLGKALSVRSGLPHVTLPTTYAGSEMTDTLGETEAGRKVTRRAPAILPGVVIYDAELTRGLPPAISGISGINALAHAIEALYAPDSNPITDLMALEAIAALRDALPAVINAPDDLEARARAQYGAWLCGACLGAVTMSLHHKICHTLGGSFDLPHAETHTVMLPHALAYNAPAIPGVMARLGRVLGPDPAGALFELSGRLGARRALRDLGMPRKGIGAAVDLVLANPYANPRPLEAEALRAILMRAWSGDQPSS